MLRTLEYYKFIFLLHVTNESRINIRLTFELRWQVTNVVKMCNQYINQLLPTLCLLLEKKKRQPVLVKTNREYNRIAMSINDISSKQSYDCLYAT